MARRKAYKRWPHTEEERMIIRRYGGTPLRKYGTDGILHGRPVEVRSIHKDDRYRIQENVHQNLVCSCSKCNQSKHDKDVLSWLSSLNRDINLIANSCKPLKRVLYEKTRDGLWA